MRGKDGEIHSTTLDSSSLLEVAAKATHDWSMLWWFAGQQSINVRHGEDFWKL
jgi:hypothetical protein